MENGFQANDQTSERTIQKVCPFCKTEIKDEDEVLICPDCGTPHHKGCWEENKGCTTLGCKKVHEVTQETDSAEKCPKCGTTLSGGQLFCPSCGTPTGGSVKRFCGKCGNELQKGQEFCPKCGKKTALPFSSKIAAKNGQLNTAFNPYAVSAKKKNKKVLYIGVIAAAIAIAILLAFLLMQRGRKPSLQQLYDEYCDKIAGAEIAFDGSYLSIDDNRFDIKDYTDEDADDAIQAINKELGFSDSLWQKMLRTSSNDGRQTDTNGKITVSWKYHPSRGLEVTYELKK